MLQYFLLLGIFLFSICVLIFFQSSPKKSIKVRNNVVCVVARLIFVLCLAVITGPLQRFSTYYHKLKKLEFYGTYFQTMLLLVTVFQLESTFRSQDIDVFVTTFWSCQKKGWIRKISLASTFITSQSGLQTIAIHILPNISESIANKTMKFGQLMEYNKRNIFL